MVASWFYCRSFNLCRSRGGSRSIQCRQIIGTLQKRFQCRFLRNYRFIHQMRQIVIEAAEEKGRNVEEELQDVIPKAYGFFRAYLDKENVEPPSIEDLGVAPPPKSKMNRSYSHEQGHAWASYFISNRMDLDSKPVYSLGCSISDGIYPPNALRHSISWRMGIPS